MLGYSSKKTRPLSVTYRVLSLVVLRLTKTLVCSLLVVPMSGTARRSVSMSRALNLETAKQIDLRRAPTMELLRSATDLYRAGRYLDAMHGFEAMRAAAERAGLRDLAARALGNLGGCQFALHDYTAALATFKETNRLAKAAGDNSAV